MFILTVAPISKIELSSLMLIAAFLEVFVDDRL